MSRNRPKLLERLVTSQNEEKQVKVVYEQLKKLNRFPFKSTDKPENRKSATVSVELRQAGNDVYLKGADNVTALVLYTRSIAAAPYPTSEGEASEELGFAFGNRSAVYFRLGKYEACLRDIKQAFAFKYPERLGYKLIERRAECCRKLGRSDPEGAAASYQSESAAKLEPDGATSTIEGSVEHLNVQDGGDAAATGGSSGIKSLPRLSHGQHELIPAASAAVDIILHPEMGRHFVANRDIEPADILVVEKPIASILLTDFIMTHCYSCKKRFDALIPCKTCDIALYCSEECRSTSWQESHRIECRMYSALNDQDKGWQGLMGLPLRTLLHMCRQNQGILGLYRLVRSLKESNADGFDKNGHYNSSDYTTITNMVNDNKRLPREQLMVMCTLDTLVVNCLEAYSDFFTSCASPDNKTSVAKLKSFTAGLLLKFMGIYRTNNVTLHELVIDSKNKSPVRGMYGKAIYPTTRLFNHSCNPNANTCFFEGDVCVVVATRPVKNGEGIFLCYETNYLYKEKTERKLILKDKFFFDCKCQACVNDWPLDHNFLYEKDTTYLCERCHITLLAQTTTHVRCPKCRESYHLGSLEERRWKIMQRVKELFIKSNARHFHEYTAELTGIVKTVHSFIESPNPAIFHNEIMLHLSVQSSGNVNVVNE